MGETTEAGSRQGREGPSRETPPSRSDSLVTPLFWPIDPFSSNRTFTWECFSDWAIKEHIAFLWCNHFPKALPLNTRGFLDALKISKISRDYFTFRCQNQGNLPKYPALQVAILITLSLITFIDHLVGHSRRGLLARVIWKSSPLKEDPQLHSAEMVHRWYLQLQVR